VRVVIIGNGGAGISAAGEIRKNMPDAEIAIVCDEPYYHYYRPRVIEYLAGKASVDDITVRKKEWYDKNSISFLSGTRVTKIDADGKKIKISPGEDIIYDKLIIAAGARSFLPPFPGASSKGVFTLRTVKDADKILEYSRDRKKGVIIGGGLLGIESGAALAARGKDITIIEFSDRLLPRQLDGPGSGALTGMLEKKGIKFLFPRKTSGIDKTEGGKLRINFENGEPVETDFAVVSAGIRPDLSLTGGTDIKADRGIMVNELMETNVKDIYACGDIAEYKGRVYGIWPAAAEQGSACGRAIAGKGPPYNGTVMAAKLKVAGINLASAGKTEAGEGEKELTEKSGEVYKKLVVKNDVIKGAILLGDTGSYVKVQKYIKSGEDASGQFDVILKGAQ